MRLSKQEHQAIRETVQEYLKGELFLFGSRTKDHLKGGDIDLLLIVEDEKLESSLLKKAKVLADVKSIIGEQKIDLYILGKSQRISDPFYQNIKDSLVNLNTLI